MYSTIHNSEKEVKIELGLMPENLSDDCNIEMAFLAKDRSFTQVLYLNRAELETLMAHGQIILAELDRQEAQAFLNQSRN